MAENANTEALESAAPTTESTTTATPNAPSLEDALKKLAHYEAEASKNAELLTKLRKFEKENKEKAEKEAIEAGKYKELYEAARNKLQDIETKVKTQAIDSALKEALTAAKAKSVSTVMKLVDRSKVALSDDGTADSKSVAALIKELQSSDPILFSDDATSTTASEGRTVVVPAPHKAGEGAVSSGYEIEVRRAKNASQIEEVMRKYGKL